MDINDYENIEKIMKVLANKTSLAIISAILKHGEACACELEPALGIGQPLVTTYLRKLYVADILGKREEWRFTYYFIRDEYKELLSYILERLSPEKEERNST